MSETARRGVFLGADLSAGVVHERPRLLRRALSFAAAVMLASTTVIASIVIGAAPANAIPPFPISDNTTGTPGTQNPNWARIVTNNTVGNTYTSDGFLRLTSNGGGQATNIQNSTAFPSSTGFQIAFDYRQAGGNRFNNRTGDGLAFYLVDGTAPITAGANGSGLGYARGSSSCGVQGGYLGLGLDIFGNYAGSGFGSSGGDGTLNANPPLIGLRGSGPGNCSGAGNTQYPWVAGASAPALWTGTVGSTADPATVANSQYRRVIVTVNPSGGNVQVTVQISAAAVKTAPATGFTQVFTANLSAVAGQVPLPSTLKLGFSASTGNATDYHDIRNVKVSALTDAAITKTLSASTPGHAGLPAGTFLPGDPISFTLNARNNGPTTIGNPPNGVANVYDDLSSLPITGASWTCTPAGGASCNTGGGSGAVVSENWSGPAGSSVAVTVTGTVAAQPGSYTNTAVIPTNFTNNTVDPLITTVQRDGGAIDTNLANNTATAGFTVVQPHFTQVKTSNKASYVVGEPITYTVTVANDGTGPGTATLSDTVPSTVAVNGVTCAPAGGAVCTANNTGNTISGSITAPPGSSAVYTITGTVTGPGSALNVASVAVTTPGCTAACGGGDAGTPPIVTENPPTITLIKNVDGRVQPADQFTVGVNDAGGTVLSSATTVGTATTAMTTQLTVTRGSTYTITDQLAAGSPSTLANYTPTIACTNIATGAVVTPGGSATNWTLTASDPTDYRCVITNTGILPSLSIVKSASPSDAASYTVGQIIDYSFVVTNTGNTTLANITVNEGAFTGSGTLSAITCPAGAALLQPNEQVVCTASYTLTQDDINAGEITNDATATGTPPSGTPVGSPPSEVTIPGDQEPSISLLKTASPTTITAAGDTIAYSFVVSNTGNVTVTDITVDETDFSGTGTSPVISCPTGPLAPSAAVTCTASYSATQEDIDEGTITNTAVASAADPDGDDISSAPSTATVTAASAPAISIVKSALPITVAGADESIAYSFVVTNTGNVTLSDVEVIETAFSGTGSLSAIDCPAAAASLAPADSVTCTADYTTTQEDANAGVVTNTASATGTPPSGTPPTAPPSTATVTIPAAPALSIVKSVTPDTVAAAGATVEYSFLVTNTGNVTLSGIAVTETAFSGTGTAPAVTCPAGAASLAPTASITCTASYQLTQNDADAGTVTNTAVADGTPPNGPAVTSPPSSATVTIDPVPAITVAKSASPSDAASFTVGQEIDYSFVVTNTGTVTLTDVTVDETAFSGSGSLSAITCPAGAASLAPSAQITCTATYTLTQPDVDAGTLQNAATATGTPPTGPDTVSPPSEVTIPGDPAPAISFEKTASPTTVTAVGQTVSYSFLVTNTGNVTLHDIVVDETAFSGTGTAPVISCPSGAANMLPAAQVTCTASYVVTQEDVDAGSVTNTATATGTPPSGPAVTSPPSSATVTAIQDPAITVLKSAAPSDAASYLVGQQITYSFVVTNTGNVTLSDVTVDEGAFTGSGTLSAITCPAGAASLAPSAQIICTATYTLTQEDVDAGSITNDATATGTPPTGPDPVSPPSEVTIPGDPNPAITIVKSATPSSVSADGDEISYTFLVSNTGNVTLTDIAVTETAFTGTGTAPVIDCPDVEALAPGESVTCTAEYTVTQEDVDSGTVENTATAGGTPPVGPAIESPPSSAVVTVDQVPAISVVKSATPATVAAVGDAVSYSFVVTNTGNVTLDDVTVDETAFTGTGTAPVVSCPAEAASLAPGDAVTCSASYTVTQEDVDSGSIENTAAATGTPPSGPAVTSPPSSATVTAAPEPAIAIVKSASPSDAASFTVGQSITYSFVVTNTGNVTLTNPVVSEGTFSGSGALSSLGCPAVTTFLPGDQFICTASYTVTQEDVDAGELVNDATATGTPPTGPDTVSPPSEVTIPGIQSPEITLVKSATPTTIAAVGGTVSYSFLVTNTGNVTLGDVTVDETAFTGTGTVPVVNCPAEAASLAPGDAVACSASYTATQEDVDRGTIENTAVATGTPPVGAAIDSEPSSATVTIESAPALTLVKSATPTTIAAVGDVISYSFLVTNTGNVTLENVTVDETAFTGTGTAPVVNCPAEAASLAPGDAVTCSASYTVTQEDVDSGSITNTATTTGTPPTGPDLVSPPSSVTVDVSESPALTVVKSASPSGSTSFTVGQVIDYSFVVTNTGNVTLTGVTIDETAFTGTGPLSPIACGPAAASLAPEAQVVCSATYTLTQEDVDAGTLSNTATATGTPPTGPDPVSPPSTVDIPSVDEPGLELVKTATPATANAAGDAIRYSFELTNTGNVTLTDLAIVEGSFSGTGTLSAIFCPASTVLPGAVVVCTADYVLTQEDVDAGSVSNTATGTGSPPEGGTVETPPSSTTVTIPPAGSLSLVKSATPSDLDSFVAGQVIDYSFVVTNTGTVTLTDVVVDEIAFSGTGPLSLVECPAAVALMLPGDQVVCSASYTVTQEDVDAGSVTNTATATGVPPTGPTPVSPPSTVQIPGDQDPSMTVVKSADVTRVTSVGQLITYSFLVTNDGNVTMSNVTVVDSKFTGTGELSPIVCPVAAAVLAPGQSVVCTADYRVTSADFSGSPLSNTAIVTGNTPSTPYTSDPSTVTIETPEPSPLAHTGGDVNTNLTIGACALMLFGGAVLLLRRYRSQV